MTIIKDVIDQFKKAEVAKVADEIGVKYDPSLSREALAQLTVDNLRKIALDETSDVELSDLAYELAITAEIIDQEGTLLEGAEQEQTKNGKPIPACFGFEDDTDPSCQKCPWIEECKVERVKIRPKCFGTSRRDVNSPECRMCLEFSECEKGG